MEKFDIIGIGDADVDILVSVPHLPSYDEKVKGKILGQYPGGIISNFLCAASRFGARCAAVVRTGDDERGKISLEDLRAHGVDTSHCICYPGTSTYFTLSCVDASGEKSMVVCLDGSTQPEISDLPMEFLSQTSYVHMIGTYADAVLAVGRECRKRGVRLSIDIERQEWQIPQEKLREILSLTYIAFPNERGLAYTSGKDSVEEGCAWMLRQGCRIVVATLGAKGVYVCTEKEAFTFPAFRVDVRDTTGAGDTFNAAFLSCLSKGYDLQACARLATAASALQIQQIGARGGMPQEKDARQFLLAHGVCPET